MTTIQVTKSQATEMFFRSDLRKPGVTYSIIELVSESECPGHEYEWEVVVPGWKAEFCRWCNKMKDD